MENIVVSFINTYGKNLIELSIKNKYNENFIYSFLDGDELMQLIAFCDNNYGKLDNKNIYYNKLLRYAMSVKNGTEYMKMTTNPKTLEFDDPFNDDLLESKNILQDGIISSYSMLLDEGTRRWYDVIIRYKNGTYLLRKPIINFNIEKCKNVINKINDEKFKLYGLASLLDDNEINRLIEHFKFNGYTTDDEYYESKSIANLKDIEDFTLTVIRFKEAKNTGKIYKDKRYKHLVLCYPEIEDGDRTPNGGRYWESFRYSDGMKLMEFLE